MPTATTANCGLITRERSGPKNPTNKPGRVVPQLGSTSIRPGTGGSVGHYDGDTLVIDTIGLNDKTFVGNYRTPHGEKLHVTERWRLIEDGNMLEVSIKVRNPEVWVEDPDTYYEPWSAIQRFRRVQQQMREEVCAENNQHLFDYGIPVANKPDF
jgi:hypothetical protein